MPASRTRKPGSLAALATAIAIVQLGIGSIGLAGCDGKPGSPLGSPDAAGPSDSNASAAADSGARDDLGDAAFVIRRDAGVRVEQPGPHEGGGRTTAYRYFDDVPNASLEFRKRALHAGAAIGPHALAHDEVYYVLAGRGELTVNDSRIEVGPETAVFMRMGATVGLRQSGTEDLVIIISYPPPAKPH